MWVLGVVSEQGAGGWRERVAELVREVFVVRLRRGDCRHHGGHCCEGGIVEVGVEG